MKILTLRQPWAFAVIHLGKDIENRDWLTRHRGPLLIHAGATCSRAEYSDALHFIEENAIALPEPMPWYTALPLGCIVGVVDVVDMALRHPSPWRNEARYGWVLANPRPLPHIPFKGKQGLFESTPDLLRRLGL